MLALDYSAKINEIAVCVYSASRCAGNTHSQSRTSRSVLTVANCLFTSTSCKSIKQKICCKSAS